MPEPTSQPRAETGLTFGSALAGFFSPFSYHSSRFRISKFALGLRLQLPRNLCVRFCLFRFFGRSSGFFLCTL